MIVDTQDPRDVEVSQVRSRNTIKNLVLDVVHQMRGNGKDSETLDDTRSRYESGIQPNDSEFRANDRRVQIPQWLLLFLILQGAGIIWWAATIQSDLKYLQLENAKLWTRLEAVDRSASDRSKELDSQIKNTIKDEIASQLANQLLTRGIVGFKPSNP